MTAEEADKKADAIYRIYGSPWSIASESTWRQIRYAYSQEAISAYLRKYQ